MLMIVPLMIWSARTVIDSQACSSEMSMPVAMAARRPMSERRRDAEDRRGVAWPNWATSATPRTSRRTRRQHHALDADVDDAGALVDHAAQRAEARSGAASARMIGAIGQDHVTRKSTSWKIRPSTGNAEERFQHLSRMAPSGRRRAGRSQLDRRQAGCAAEAEHASRSRLARGRTGSIAWRKSIIWTGTPAWICISGAPARMAPSSRPRTGCPTGLRAAEEGTVMASKPTFVRVRGRHVVLTPRISIAPARPASSPPTVRASTIRRRGRMPA